MTLVLDEVIVFVFLEFGFGFITLTALLFVLLGEWRKRRLHIVLRKVLIPEQPVIKRNCCIAAYTKFVFDENILLSIGLGIFS